MKVSDKVKMKSRQVSGVDPSVRKARSSISRARFSTKIKLYYFLQKILF